MPIAEPTDALWSAVKAKVPWPDTNEDSVRTLAGSWESAAGAFDRAAATNTADLTTSWTDTAGVAMFTRAHRVLTQAGDNGQAMRQVAARVTAFADEVAAAKQSLVDLIAKNAPTYQNLAKLPAGAADSYRAQFASQVATLAQRVLTESASRISKGAGAPLTAPDHGPPPAAPPPGDPAAVKAWWDGLSDADRAKVMQDAPDSIRNRDGIPATVRDSLNRAALDREIDTANAALKADQNQGYNPYTGGGGGVPDGGDSALQERVRGLTALRDRLNGGGPPAFLLELDTTADGKGVVATGNPDTAANVTTYVPGTMADLNSIAGDVHRADVMYDAAQAAGSPSTSVITWVGYDAPDELYNAASESYADGGKADLQTFQDGLRATHAGPASHNTVLGHSYGTTTIGHAARDGGLNADDVVFVASPGVGVDHADQLHLDGVDQAHVAEHVHSTTAANDMIGITNIKVNPDPYAVGAPAQDIALGPDPADPAFGGDVFASAPGTPGLFGGLSGAAHSEYWDRGNPSLPTIGDIIAGRR